MNDRNTQSGQICGFEPWPYGNSKNILDGITALFNCQPPLRAFLSSFCPLLSCWCLPDYHHSRDPAETGGDARMGRNAGRRAGVPNWYNLPSFRNIKEVLSRALIVYCCCMRARVLMPISVLGQQSWLSQRRQTVLLFSFLVYISAYPFPTL